MTEKRDAINIPLRRQVVYTMVLGFVAIWLVTVLIAPSILTIVTISSVSVFVIVGVSWQEYYGRPARMTIMDGGVLFSYRGGRQEYVEWSDIQGVVVRRGGDPTAKSGEWTTVGGIRTSRRPKWINISVEAAEAIIDGYKEATGRSPPALMRSTGRSP